MSSIPLPERFTGCLLGLAVGDALGGRFEGQSADWIAARYPTPEALTASPPADTLHYTDDTQMAIGVAETLIENLDVLEDRLCHHFVSNYVPSRGYGQGARRVLEAMEEGRDHKEVAATHFPGGSLGNGAAMRVAPVGLFFHDQLDQVWEQARLSALPTHTHSLGIEGAQLLAVAVALCLGGAPFDRATFFGELLRRCQSDEYRARLGQAATARLPEEVARLGNGIKAPESVPTAIALFASAPSSYAEVVGRAILLGGDTDTIAAMAGALSGAHLGVHAIPAELLRRLEDDEKGRTYIADLAERLHQACELSAGS
ncbi:MAG TPA: ADP-ribosylglycohydrolase family protein [Gemmataceae bacterium]|nr:ADP-ribosylglycohydrolase family protein [Gemmataceae bacterium]